MPRKKWTPQTDITESLIKFREKRKWQLSYRRYVLEKKPSQAYAHYFGLDIETLRQWFEIQFTPDINWENYAKAWQFDHIVPTTYFNYSDEQDLKLCWSFINVRIEALQLNKNRGNRIDLLAVRPYFQDLYTKTNFSLCQKMLEKIETIQISKIESHPNIENFINQNKDNLQKISTFDRYEFGILNQGTTVADILLEREILRKFGSAPKH